MCELENYDLDRYDMCQGGVKMLLVDRYDHIIYNYGKKQYWKEIELIYEGKYSNPHIWIWMFVKWFKKFGSDASG
jgi:hypothetical protein